MNSDAEKSKTNWKSRMVVIVVAILIFLVTLAALQIDDWSRDLTTNTATTSKDARNPLMRPTEVNMTVAEAEELVRRCAQRLSAWEFVERIEQEDENSIELHLTRTSGVFQFVDDVHVEITRTDDHSLIHIRSASRVGKGDLGQNPRNVRTLNNEIRTLAGE